VSFYDEVLRELIAALGAALFLGNLVALVRRRSDLRRAAVARSARRRPGSPVRGEARPRGERDDLPRAPLSRTLLYVLLGFVVMAWGIASLLAG